MSQPQPAAAAPADRVVRVILHRAGSTPAAPRDESWLAKKFFDELSLQFRTVWDMYIKWYTVFITINIAALAIARWISEILLRTLALVLGLAAIVVPIEVQYRRCSHEGDGHDAGAPCAAIFHSNRSR